MQINVETVAPCRKRVHLVIPPERVREELESSLREASANVRLPGFRQGKVPRAVVEKRFGAAIRKDIKEQLINEGFQQALKDNNIVPLTQPELDLEKVSIDDPTGVTVDIEFDIRPEIDVKNYKGVEVKIESAKATDDETANQMSQIRKMRSRPERDDTVPVNDDSYAMATVAFTFEDKQILERDNVRVMTGMRLAGADEKEFQDSLRDKKVGESFDINLTFAEDFEVKEAAGKAGVAKITIRETYKLLYPTDEELLKQLDMPDMDTLRADVRRRIDEAKAGHIRKQAEEYILDKVAAENVFEMPTHVVDHQVEARIHQNLQQMQQAKQLPENWEELLPKERERLRPEMEKGLRRLFLLEAIAKKEKIFVTEDDLEAEFRLIAERNQSTPEEVVQYYQQNNLIGALRIDLLESKVRAFLFENAKRTE
ncbi:MAG: trigger factor [Planctomycetota bacterium]